MNFLHKKLEHSWKIIFDQGFVWDNILICYCDKCGIVKKEENDRTIYFFSKIHENKSTPNSQECLFN